MVEEIQVEFKINYKTEFGQVLALVGDCEQVGNWKDFHKTTMEWTEGDWWKITLKIPQKSFFLYKYVVVDY